MRKTTYTFVVIHETCQTIKPFYQSSLVGVTLLNCITFQYLYDLNAFNSRIYNTNNTHINRSERYLGISCI